MTLEKATELANKFTKQFKKYYTAIPCLSGSGWTVSNKYHPKILKD